MAFMEFYERCYGSTRWESLLIALKKPMRSIALMNKFAVREDCNRLLGIERNECSQFLSNYPYGYRPRHDQHLDLREEDRVQGIGEPIEFEEKKEKVTDISLMKKELYPWPSPSLSSSLDRNNLYCYYPLDGASIFPVLALDLTPTSRVFDMCAAPGGKSLVILSHLDLLCGGTLTCCDISSSRRFRLSHTFQNYLPPSLSDSIRILSGDASSPSFYHQYSDLFSSSQSSFDRILVDAPCSSERHLLHSSQELAKWSSHRSKVNSKRQFSLLYHALNSCAIPGRVVYSTCSLNPQENDEVVARVLKHFKKRFQKRKTEKEDAEVVRGFVVPQVDLVEGDSLKIPYGEKTECGWIILPDRCDGMGPIYFAVLELKYADIDSGLDSNSDSGNEREERSVKEGSHKSSKERKRRDMPRYKVDPQSKE
jgi:16S rRNA C967 or C1407 C5-methylase (RsmB/RsmF family)